MVKIVIDNHKIMSLNSNPKYLCIFVQNNNNGGKIGAPHNLVS